MRGGPFFPHQLSNWKTQGQHPGLVSRLSLWPTSQGRHVIAQVSPFSPLISQLGTLPDLCIGCKEAVSVWKLLGVKINWYCNDKEVLWLQTAHHVAHTTNQMCPAGGCYQV